MTKAECITKAKELGFSVMFWYYDSFIERNATTEEWLNDMWSHGDVGTINNYGKEWFILYNSNPYHYERVKTDKEYRLTLPWRDCAMRNGTYMNWKGETNE